MTVPPQSPTSAFALISPSHVAQAAGLQASARDEQLVQSARAAQVRVDDTIDELVRQIRSPVDGAVRVQPAIGLDRSLAQSIRDISEQLAASSGVPMEQIESHMLRSMAQQVESLQSSQPAMQDAWCLTLDEVREDLHQQINQQLQAMRQTPAGGIPPSALVAPYPTEMARVFATISARNQGVDDSLVDSASFLAPQALGAACAIAEHLGPTVARALTDFGVTTPQHLEAARDALNTAAATLALKGIDTPAKVDAFLDGVRAHDNRMALLGGCLSQLGYGGGMGLFTYVLGDPIAAGVLVPATASAGVAAGGAAFGAVLGGGVGYLDALASAGAASFLKEMSILGSGPFNNQAAEDMHKSSCAQLGISAGLNAGATLVKNLVFRAILPTLVYAQLSDPVTTSTRNHVDYVGDAGGALLSGALYSSMKSHVLDTQESAAFKLLSQTNLGHIIDQADRLGMWQRPNPQLLKDGVMAYLKGLAHGVIEAPTYTATASIAGWVSALMAVNGMLGAHFASAGVAGAATSTMSALAESAIGTTAVNGAELRAATMTTAEHVARALVASVMMAGLAGGTTLVAGGTAIACARDAVNGARGTLDGSDGVQEPLGLRHRSTDGDRGQHVVWSSRVAGEASTDV